MRHDDIVAEALPAGIRLLLCLALILGLTSCSGISERLAGSSPQMRARTIDSQLAAADWEAVKPQTPEQEQYLRSLAPLLMHHEIGDDGRLRFWMADPYNCHCVFYGNQAEYLRYRIIERDEERSAYEASNSAGYAATAWHRQFCGGLPPYVGGGFGCVPPHRSNP